LQQTTIHRCFQCGAKLIFVSKKVDSVPGSLFPQTSSIYRCSDKECQKEKDMETAKRIKIKNERLAESKKRLDLRLSKTR